MFKNNRLKIAVQKSGRLNEKSLEFLSKSGLEWEMVKDRLAQECTNLPIDIMFVRDDDIPRFVGEGVCHLGIVGQNLLEESLTTKIGSVQILSPLDFGRCRLSIAVPQNQNFSSLADLNGLRIASSYPRCLRSFLNKNKIKASLVELSGTVEIAPKLGIADAICDLVSTGSTLRSNGLKECATVFQSQAVLIQTTKPLDESSNAQMNQLLERMGVLCTL